MSRLAAVEDVFTAIAEPHRRRILDVLIQGERSVGDIVSVIHISQPLASKHLRVLRDVNLVNVRSDRQQRFYSLNANGLKPIHAWAGSFACFWNESFDRLATYLDQLQAKKRPHEPHP
jgi:DNA-binding transcriptional ArsR family regulator